MTTEQQLKILEKKVDKILMLLGAKQESSQADDFKTVLATSGVDGLKNFIKRGAK